MKCIKDSGPKGCWGDSHSCSVDLVPIYDTKLEDIVEEDNYCFYNHVTLMWHLNKKESSGWNNRILRYSLQQEVMSQ